MPLIQDVTEGLTAKHLQERWFSNYAITEVTMAFDTDVVPHEQLLQYLFVNHKIKCFC